MARTFDPLRHQARRMVIIDAALTCFAAEGFHRTTTAAICRTAGIGSGTFFHYFPTKLSVLLGVLDVGTAESAAWFAAQAGRTDPARVIEDYVAHVADECADPRVAGFVRAVTAVLTEPDVVMALARDEAVVREGLLPWIRAAQEARQVRGPTSRPHSCARGSRSCSTASSAAWRRTARSPQARWVPRAPCSRTPCGASWPHDDGGRRAALPQRATGTRTVWRSGPEDVYRWLPSTPRHVRGSRPDSSVGRASPW